MAGQADLAHRPACAFPARGQPGATRPDRLIPGRPAMPARLGFPPAAESRSQAQSPGALALVVGEGQDPPLAPGGAGTRPAPGAGSCLLEAGAVAGRPWRRLQDWAPLALLDWRAPGDPPTGRRRLRWDRLASAFPRSCLLGPGQRSAGVGRAAAAFPQRPTHLLGQWLLLVSAWSRPAGPVHGAWCHRLVGGLPRGWGGDNPTAVPWPGRRQRPRDPLLRWLAALAPSAAGT